jgi:uncharacterized protein (TIGR02466 family)
MSGARQSLTDLLHEAVRHLNGGDWPLASSRLQQVLALDPRHAVAAYLLGVAEFRQDHWSEAERLFRKALLADSAPPGVSLHLACALQAQGRFPESEQVLWDTPRDRLDPAEQVGWSHRMGLALKHQRRHAEALEHLQRAHRAAPQDRQICLDLAVLWQHLRSYDAAAGVLAELIERTPLDMDAHLQLNDLLYRPDSLIDAAAFLLRRQQALRAKLLLLKSLDLRPADQAALSLLCLCHRALGEEREESWLAGYEDLVACYDLLPPAGYGAALEFNRRLAAYLEPLHDDKREHLTQTLRGGTRLYDEVFNNGHTLIDRLRAEIDKAVAHYVAHLRADDRHPFLSRRTAGFRYVSSWSSRLLDRGFHLNHVHAQGWISSAYYVSVPPACRNEQSREGWLKLGEPTEDFGAGFPPRRYIQPKPGRLVLFPSHLWHGTVPFSSAQTRITIAFDVAPL